MFPNKLAVQRYIHTVNLMSFHSICSPGLLLYGPSNFTVYGRPPTVVIYHEKQNKHIVYNTMSIPTKAVPRGGRCSARTRLSVVEKTLPISRIRISETADTLVYTHYERPGLTSRP